MHFPVLCKFFTVTGNTWPDLCFSMKFPTDGQACLCFPRQTLTERCACVFQEMPPDRKVCYISQERSKQKGVPVFPKTDPDRKVCMFSKKCPKTERRACVPQEKPRQKGVRVFPKKDPDRKAYLCSPRKTQTERRACVSQERPR